MSEILSPEDVLKMSLKDIPPVVVVPSGHWKVQVVSEPKIKTVDRDNPNAPVGEMLAAIKLLEPGNDVSEVELEGFDVAESGRGFFRIPLFNFKAEVNKVVRFLQILGISTDTGIVEDWLKQAKGGVFVTNAVRRQNKSDPEAPDFVDFKGYQADQA